MEKEVTIKTTKSVFSVVVILLILTSCDPYRNKFHLDQLQPLSDRALETQSYSFSDKVVLAYYYIWYQRNDFYEMKSSFGDLKDIRPVLGPYDSHDPYIIEEHMRMARRAKIDALAVSWWFGRSLFLGLIKGMNKKLDLVFRIAHLHDLKVTIVLEVEDLENMQDVTESLRYYLTKYYHNPATLRMEGKPVILIWASWLYPPEEWQKTFDQLKTEGLSAFYLPSLQTDPGYLGPFRGLEKYALPDIDDGKLARYYLELRKRVEEYNKAHPERPAQWHATIMPGYDDRRIPDRSGLFKDRDNGQYYRMTFEAALASNPKWIHITSFNELPERTHIEPTEEFGWTYIDMTAEFVNEFKSR